MSRKQYVTHLSLEHVQKEILSYNTKRISATIIPDLQQGANVLAFGNSGQHTKSGAWIAFSDFNLEWKGINPLWAIVPEGNSVPVILTILELVEE